MYHAAVRSGSGTADANSATDGGPSTAGTNAAAAADAPVVVADAPPAAATLRRHPLLLPEIVGLVMQHLLDIDERRFLVALRTHPTWAEHGLGELWYERADRTLLGLPAERRQFYAQYIVRLTLSAPHQIEDVTALQFPRLRHVTLEMETRFIDKEKRRGKEDVVGGNLNDSLGSDDDDDDDDEDSSDVDDADTSDDDHDDIGDEESDDEGDDDGVGTGDDEGDNDIDDAVIEDAVIEFLRTKLLKGSMVVTDDCRTKQLDILCAWLPESVTSVRIVGDDVRGDSKLLRFFAGRPALERLSLRPQYLLTADDIRTLSSAAATTAAGAVDNTAHNGSGGEGAAAAAEGKPFSGLLTFEGRLPTEAVPLLTDALPTLKTKRLTLTVENHGAHRQPDAGGRLMRAVCALRAIAHLHLVLRDVTLSNADIMELRNLTGLRTLTVWGGPGGAGPDDVVGARDDAGDDIDNSDDDGDGEDDDDDEEAGDANEVWFLDKTYDADDDMLINETRPYFDGCLRGGYGARARLRHAAAARAAGGRLWAAAALPDVARGGRASAARDAARRRRVLPAARGAGAARPLRPARAGGGAGVVAAVPAPRASGDEQCGHHAGVEADSQEVCSGALHRYPATRIPVSLCSPKPQPLPTPPPCFFPVPMSVI
jgi:hypothetical protein